MKEKSDAINKRIKIIDAGYKAVDELIRVAEKKIEIEDTDDALSDDKLKSAAQTKKIAIFDAFEILQRIQTEEDILKQDNGSKGKEKLRTPENNT
jgi:hypothetical protein